MDELVYESKPQDEERDMVITSLLCLFDLLTDENVYDIKRVSDTIGYLYNKANGNIAH